MGHDNYPGDICEPVDACSLLTWPYLFLQKCIGVYAASICNADARASSFLRIRKAKCAQKKTCREKLDRYDIILI